MLVSAVVSNMLAHWRIEKFVEEHASELQPPGEPPFTVEPPPPFRPRPSYVNLSFIIAGSLGLVLALLLSTLLARRISRPLSDLASATRKIAAGDYTDRVNVDGGMEV
ncbi:MAG: HAMP domain-containing protein, partial [Actinobacteria bacterium]|nr:HAMP domain-containing protein [Actinomycetota bacterium]